MSFFEFAFKFEFAALIIILFMIISRSNVKREKRLLILLLTGNPCQFISIYRFQLQVVFEVLAPLLQIP